MFKDICLAFVLALCVPSAPPDPFYATVDLLPGFPMACVGTNYRETLSGNLADLDCHTILFLWPTHYVIEDFPLHDVREGTGYLTWQLVNEPIYYIVMLHELSGDEPCFGVPSQGTTVEDGIMDLRCDAGRILLSAITTGPELGQWQYPDE